MSISFDEYESKLIAEAAKMLSSFYRDPYRERKNYRRIVCLAIMAYCRGAIIYGGEISNFPTVAELRQETASEKKDRVADVLPDRVGHRAALAILAAKNNQLAQEVCEMGTDEVLVKINTLELIAAIIAGKPEKIASNAPLFDAKHSAHICALSLDRREECIKDAEKQISDLREYLKNLSEPLNTLAGIALTDSELHYCEVEGVDPSEFLKSKTKS